MCVDLCGCMFFDQHVHGQVMSYTGEEGGRGGLSLSTDWQRAEILSMLVLVVRVLRGRRREGRRAGEIRKGGSERREAHPPPQKKKKKTWLVSLLLLLLRLLLLLLPKYYLPCPSFVFCFL